MEILLVEDSPGDVRLTQEVLREANSAGRLHVVSDGVEAMAFLRQEISRKLRENAAGCGRRHRTPMVVVDQDGEIILLNLQTEKQFGSRHDEKSRAIIPDDFAERLIEDVFATRRIPWRSRSERESSSSGAGRIEARFPSRSC